MSAYGIAGIGILLILLIFMYDIWKRNESYNLLIISIIIANITIFIIVYMDIKDGNIEINKQISNLNDVCINNTKGFLYTEKCKNKKECSKINNLIAYRKVKIYNDFQAVYFIPYNTKMVCNKDDSEMIINELNNIKNDFTILIE